MLNKVLHVILLFFVSCSGNSDSMISPETEVAIIPSNLSLTIDVLGLDTENPNGDGSGTITCKATAFNAVTYGFKIENEAEVKSASGELDYTFSREGTNNYLVTVFAYSSTGHTISLFKTITVYVGEKPLKLVWSDEFDVNGEPDDSKWGYDLGNGCPNLCGWGNGEKQYYTNRPENVKVEDGVLKITAKMEAYQGFNYTSARLLTKDKYEFTYGKVEVKAKLPSGSGTWPAIWMLGANIDTVGWPACGEIDIMEHWGHNPKIVSSATHTPACSGGCSGTKVGETTVNDFSSGFHVYGLEWTEDALHFSLDGTILYTYKPDVKDSNTWPYTKPQFLILNIAMGGNWFTIDENFTESTMEIDYIKIYQ
ncbi:glycoside hydrolase family 16 protein [Snuella sedimenti]|uniref:Glycoside hydrolase family 16 protein n=1 Tax=Snuella sedimenti TaxID=2798802 RepID=A0A8J7IPB5_9FLAO|nr:glycoside hydrolase family 16 protein [Snuella sedimenti]MBJ6368442.1 glycoside hydrolase family 16 protein [Snuella sedimenti]